jgi:glycosyltransferase involved in cell wall biosynthesis
MPCAEIENCPYPTAVCPEFPRIIWAGRIDDNKRLDWFLEIAARLPAFGFEIAAAANGAVSKEMELREKAKAIANVRWLGTLSRKEMSQFYLGATCLCCTSKHEGFPNTFVEAWNHGVPVVTTFDPDGLVTRMGLGFTASNPSDFAAAITNLVCDQAKWLQISANVRLYYQNNHQPDAALERFTSLFESVLSE